MRKVLVLVLVVFLEAAATARGQAATGMMPRGTTSPAAGGQSGAQPQASQAAAATVPGQAATPAAQDEAQVLDRFNRRIPPFVVDVRAMMPKLPKNDQLGAPYGVAGAALPSVGIGVEVGAHVYPIRTKSWAVGLGVAGELGAARARAGEDDNGNVTGADVDASFKALSPQLSINFGTAAGWSYISTGLGFSTLVLDTPTTPTTMTAPRRKTINYGGGGRWFFRDHLAFTMDLRFYAVNPVAEAAHVYASPRVTMVVISAGISFR